MTAEIVIEEGPGWELVADLAADPPEHNHFDIWDATDDCPRCGWDIDHLAGND